jgi:hypothetical protein
MQSLIEYPKCASCLRPIFYLYQLAVDIYVDDVVYLKMKSMALYSKYSYMIVVPSHPYPFLNLTIDLKEHDQDHYQFVFTFLDNSESEVAYHISRTTQSLFSMMC